MAHSTNGPRGSSSINTTSSDPSSSEDSVYGNDVGNTDVNHNPLVVWDRDAREEFNRLCKDLMTPIDQSRTRQYAAKDRAHAMYTKAKRENTHASKELAVWKDELDVVKADVDFRNERNCLVRTTKLVNERVERFTRAVTTSRRELDKAAKSWKENSHTCERTMRSAIAYLIENKEGLDNEGVIALTATDKKTCAKRNRRSCPFMIASVMSVFLADPGEHTYEELGIMCSCHATSNDMKHTLDAFVKLGFLSVRKDTKQTLVHSHKMNPEYEKTMPTNFEESSPWPMNSLNVPNLEYIQLKYNAGEYNLGCQLPDRPSPNIIPIVSPTHTRTRKRRSSENTQSNNIQNKDVVNI